MYSLTLTFELEWKCGLYFFCSNRVYWITDDGIYCKRFVEKKRKTTGDINAWCYNKKGVCVYACCTGCWHFILLSIIVCACVCLNFTFRKKKFRFVSILIRFFFLIRFDQKILVFHVFIPLQYITGCRQSKKQKIQNHWWWT